SGRHDESDHEADHQPALTRSLPAGAADRCHGSLPAGRPAVRVRSVLGLAVLGTRVAGTSVRRSAVLGRAVLGSAVLGSAVLGCGIAGLSVRLRRRGLLWI